MRRYALATIAVLSLGLVACSSTDGDNQTEGATITAAETAPTTEASNGEGEDVQLNEPFEISQLVDNDVFLNVTDITLGEECRFGAYIPEYRNDDLGSDKQYLQIFAEVDVQKLNNPQSSGVVYLNGPKTVDTDGFTKEADMSADCQAGESYENWFIPTESGDKSRRYGAFIVPKGITEVRVENRVYPVQQ